MILVKQKLEGKRVFEYELPISLEQFNLCRKIMKPLVEKAIQEEPLIGGLALSIGKEALKTVLGLPKLNDLDTNVLIHLSIGKRVKAEEVPQ